MSFLGWIFPSRKPEPIDDFLAEQQADYDASRALFGLPPIPLNYTGPLRRKWRDRAARDGVEL